MFAGFEKDIAHILPQSFEAHAKMRKCLSNKSTRLFSDSVSFSGFTLLALQSDCADLSVRDEVIFENKSYCITQLETESRVMLRIYLKENKW